MENQIDLLILPPHCSHVLQPLDVGVFSAFKRRYTTETDAISRLSSQRIPRREWIELFTRARIKAITKENILAGWRGAGLSPRNSWRVLKDLPSEATTIQTLPHTPPEQEGLDLSLLKSSPPEPIELLQSNQQFTEALRRYTDVISPVKRYGERMTRMCKTQNATLAIMAKQLAEQSELLRKRKRSSKGKRVELEGVSVYSQANVLRIARETEATPVAKRPRGRPCKVRIEDIENQEGTAISETSSEGSIIELEDYIGCRTRSHA